MRGRDTYLNRICANCGKCEIVRIDSLHRLCRKCSAKKSHINELFIERQRLSHIGKPSPMRGKHHGPIAILKNRIAHLGKRMGQKTEFKKGIIPHNKKHVCEPLIKVLYSNGFTSIEIGKIYNLSKPVILKRLKKLKVIMRDSTEQLIKRVLSTPPHLHPNWRGGKTPASVKIRMSKEYKNWRTSVFERDKYTCQFCGKKGGNLEADHIKQFAFYPELRLEISNGRTLCRDCHKTTPTYLNNKPIIEMAA